MEALVGTGGGGSGGGGAGGLIYLVNENLYESGTVSVAGGAGGLTPQNSGWAHNGGDGANGRAGEVYRIDVGVSPLFSNADSWEVVGENLLLMNLKERLKIFKVLILETIIGFYSLTLIQQIHSG